MENLLPPLNEETIIKILADSVLWYRVVDNIESAMRAFTPKEQYDNFTPSKNYNGFYLVLDLMGIDKELYDDLRYDLCQIGWEYTNKNETADIIAREIYFRWLYEAKETMENLTPVL